MFAEETRTLPAPSCPAPAAVHPDVVLRDALVRNDAAAWREFELAYGRLVTATIGRIVARFGSHTGSEDVKEIRASFHLELLTNGRAKLRAYSPERGARLGTWIALLASHAAYDFLRRRRREPLSEVDWDADVLASTSPDPHTLCETSERARIVSGLMSDFSAKDCEFVELYFGEGLAPEEVAERMHISVKTVYSKKHKIRGRLSTLLDQRALAA